MTKYHGVTNDGDDLGRLGNAVYLSLLCNKCGRVVSMQQLSSCLLLMHNNSSHVLIQEQIELCENVCTRVPTVTGARLLNSREA